MTRHQNVRAGLQGDLVRDPDENRVCTDLPTEGDAGSTVALSLSVTRVKDLLGSADPIVVRLPPDLPKNCADR